MANGGNGGNGGILGTQARAEAFIIFSIEY
jgi:hypothetical protein